MIPPLLLVEQELSLLSGSLCPDSSLCLAWLLCLCLALKGDCSGSDGISMDFGLCLTGLSVLVFGVLGSLLLGQEDFSQEGNFVPVCWLCLGL